MKPIIKNSLAVVAGVFIGGAVNMGIIMISSSVIPPPPGTDLKTYEGLKAAMHLMGPIHFLMPFLAHVLGTFVGSFITSLIVPTKKLRFALGITIWFLIGGFINILMLPSPLWFTLVDLLLAYIPMGYLAYKLSLKIKS
jgi:hypothetical protein